MLLNDVHGPRPCTVSVIMEDGFLSRQSKPRASRRAFSDQLPMSLAIASNSALGLAGNLISIISVQQNNDPKRRVPVDTP
jgi:hypothetical protein